MKEASSERRVNAAHLIGKSPASGFLPINLALLAPSTRRKQQKHRKCTLTRPVQILHHIFHSCT